MGLGRACEYRLDCAQGHLRNNRSMNKLSPTSKWLLIAVAVVVVIIVIAISVGGGNSNTPGASSGTSATNNSGSAAGTQTGAQTGGTSAGTNKTGNTGSGTGSTGAKTGTTGGTGGTTSRSSISLITPTPNDTWTANTQNTVQWSRAAGVSGQIDLMTAGYPATLVGVILVNTGPNQTSFTWNTRDLLQSRTSPVKTTVNPGTYVVRVAFDGNNLSPATSQPFKIVANTSTVR